MTSTVVSIETYRLCSAIIASFTSTVLAVDVTLIFPILNRVGIVFNNDFFGY